MVFSSPEAKKILRDNQSRLESAKEVLKLAIDAEVEHLIDTFPGVEGYVEYQVKELLRQPLETFFQNFYRSLLP